MLLFSLAVNALFLIAFIIWAIRKWRFRQRQKQSGAWHSYLDNPQYIEECNLHEAYYRKGVKIVMLGTSHVRKAHWNELLNRADIANRGIGSDITEGFPYRLEEILLLQPEYCFIEGGVNDLEHNVPLESTIWHLARVISKLKMANIRPILQTEPLVAQSYPDSANMNKKLMTLNEAIWQLGSALGVRILRLDTLLAENGCLKKSYAQADGIHLTGAAYLIWADLIEEYLRENNL